MAKAVPGKRGLFITFEGTEGAGKSTLIRAVEARLHERCPERRIVRTREPGGSPLAEKIRAVILENPMDPRAELMLYEAARAEHVAQVIRPALGQGHWVLCDRFADSSLAYQAMARGLPWKEVATASRISTGGLVPDLTVWIDIDPELGLKRAREQTRFEAEGVEFQRRVRRGFQKARSESPKRWLVLRPGDATPEELAAKVAAAMTRRFGVPA